MKRFRDTSPYVLARLTLFEDGEAMALVAHLG